MRETVRTPRVLTADEIRLTDLYLDILFLVHKLDLSEHEAHFVNDTFAALHEVLLRGQMGDALRKEMTSRIETMRAAFLAHRRLLSHVAKVEESAGTGTLMAEDISAALGSMATSIHLGLAMTSAAPLLLRLEHCIARTALKHDEFERTIAILRQRGLVPHVYTRYT